MTLMSAQSRSADVFSGLFHFGISGGSAYVADGMMVICEVCEIQILFP